MPEGWCRRDEGWCVMADVGRKKAEGWGDNWQLTVDSWQLAMRGVCWGERGDVKRLMSNVWGLMCEGWGMKDEGWGRRADVWGLMCEVWGLMCDGWSRRDEGIPLVHGNWWLRGPDNLWFNAKEKGDIPYVMKQGCPDVLCFIVPWFGIAWFG